MTQLCDLIRDLRPLTLRPTVSVERACEVMRDHQSSSVLITHADDYLLGIFTGRDAIWRVLAMGKDAKTVALREVMTKEPVTISRYTTSVEALRLMWDGGFRHLPITEKGHVVGLIRRRDFRSEDINRLEEERSFWEHMR